MESKIIQGDCIDELKKLPDQSIDLIITDPPYFVPAKHYATRKNFSRNFGDLGIMEFFFKEVFNQFKRVMKLTGRIYVFCDGQSYPLFYYHLFHFCKSVRPLIWDKKVSINGYHWRHQHEIIIFAEMPESRPVPTGDGDILRCSAVKVDKRIHPAEKPVELLKLLIEKSSEANDIVLDCFAGSGSVMKACLETNRQYIMIEKELSYFELMKQSDKTSTSATPTLAEPKEFNMGLEASAQEPTPKLSPTEITSPNPNIMFNLRGRLQEGFN